MAGFADYRASIDRVTAALGGDKHVRGAIGAAHKIFLKARVGHQPGYDAYIWAGDADYEVFAQNAQTMLHRPPEGDLIACAPFRGAVIEVYETEAFLRTPEADRGNGNDYSLRLAYTDKDTYARDFRGNKRDSWRVVLTDGGELSAKEDNIYGRGGTLKSTNAGSPAGAYKSLRRMVEQFFGVELVKCGQSLSRERLTRRRTRFSNGRRHRTRYCASSARRMAALACM